MPNKNKHILEIESSLQKQAATVEKAHALKVQKYIGTTLKTYGLTSAIQNQISKQGFHFHTEDIEKTFHLYASLFHHLPSFESKNMVFLYLEKNHKKIPLILQLELMTDWVASIDNWAHSDTLSKYLTRLLENSETKKSFSVILKKWNSSTNLWERRQSLICLYYYSRTKREFIDYEFSEKMIHRLLLDEAYYVQKAVGWALRESYNAYPELTFAYIEKHVQRISSTAFTTCIEKMSDSEKQLLKQKRKR